MKSSGCYVCSISMLLRKIPSIVLEILNKNDCFTSEGALLNDKAANVLGMIYSKVYENPNKVCIAETDSNAQYGVPQHFFVWLNNGYIVDPLDGLIKLNKYHVVSYRLWDSRKGY